MPTKSSMIKEDKKKKVRINRNVPLVIHEEVAEKVAEEVIEEVIEKVEEVEQPVEEVEQPVEEVENIVLSHPEHLEEVSSLPPPPTDEEYDHPDCPVSPCVVSCKRVKKLVEPKPLINEKGEFLNPRTNRYVKQGTSAYKQLVREGVILESICV